MAESLHQIKLIESLSFPMSNRSPTDAAIVAISTGRFQSSTISATHVTTTANIDPPPGS